MKNFRYGVLFLAIVGIVLVSCKKSDEVVIKKNSQNLDFDEFYIYGQIHNSFLSNVNENFNPCDQINSYEDAIDYINQFHLEFLASLNLTIQDKEMLSLSLTENKRHNDINYSYFTLFSEENSLYMSDLIYHIKDNGAIDLFEYNSLIQLSILIKQSIEGQISYLELESDILEIKNSWLQQGYSQDSETGFLLAYVLSISMASIEWWEENPVGIENFSITNNTKALPAWAAMDIAGATVSACINISGQLATSGTINGNSVAWSAAAGGIAYSTGAVGRLARWIK